MSEHGKVKNGEGSAKSVDQGKIGPKESHLGLSRWEAQAGKFSVKSEKTAEGGQRQVVEGWLGKSSGPRDGLSRKAQKEGGGEKGRGNDGGHLIARRFGGPDVKGNVVPMEQRFNRSVASTIENSMAERLNRGPLYVRAEAVVGKDRSVDVTYRMFEKGKDGRPVEVGTVFAKADHRLEAPLGSLRSPDGKSYKDLHGRLPK